MSYSNLYFGKNLDNISYEDVNNFFIEEKIESDKIEFKSYFSTDDRNHAEKENSIIRTVCGLLNSEGGLIIWGAPVGQTVGVRREKIFKGELSPVMMRIEKDSFIRKVTDAITPAPSAIRFHLVENNGSFVYVVEVEQSFYSPHQYKNIYYMRLDGQTRPAPHHFIDALFKKVTFPRLEGYLTIESFERWRSDESGERFLLKIKTILFNKSKLQNEYDLYYRLIVTCGTFSNFRTNTDLNKIYDLDGHELRVPNMKSVVYYNEPINTIEDIIITSNELRKNNYECEVLLIFGGKYSPLKISKYKLYLMHFGRPQSEYLILIDENKFFRDDDLNQDQEEERMRRILGR